MQNTLSQQKLVSVSKFKLLHKITTLYSFRKEAISMEGWDGEL